MSEILSSANRFRFDNGDLLASLPESEAITTSKHCTYTTPISILTADVLFFIFSMNSRMETIQDNKGSSPFGEIHYGKETLTTNRYSSQVCRRWRSIILSSPTIWANSLHLDVLDQCADDWRSEVLDRTGNVPICLFGHIGFAGADYAIPFVMNILECEWDRIRCLSICTTNVNIIKQMLRSLRKPAPCLEYLDYRTTKSDRDERYSLTEPGEKLFSNKSPKLTFICCEGFIFEFASRSVSNVRQLWLTGYRASFTIPELYLGLRYLPLLEELTINHHKLLESAGLSDDTPDVHLNHLADITLQGLSAKLMTDLVRHIIPAPGCCLVASGSSFDGLYDVNISILSQVYATFIRNTANFQPVRYILLSSRQNTSFAFRAANGPLCNGKSYPSTYLAFTQHATVLSKFSIPIMKALASRTDLGHVSRLELRLDEITVACFRSEVLVFLRELVSVSTLNADLPTLRVLTAIQSTVRFLILPCITTIIMVDGRTDYPTNYLTGFLAQRLARGVPVQTLRLPKKDYFKDGRWDFLDQRRGLSVLWGRSSWPEDDDEDPSK